MENSMCAVHMRVSGRREGEQLSLWSCFICGIVFFYLKKADLNHIYCVLGPSLLAYGRAYEC